VHSVKMNKDIFKKFSPSGSQTILVLPHQTHQTSWQYSWGDPPPWRGIECRWGRQKLWFWTNSWLSFGDCCSALSTIDGRQ